ncbi:hypothetical protein BWP20_20945 [Mycobacterium tuberculosis]|nr:hypothetical protein BWP20_20945 [Mycobacterium tuberculosis]
MLRLAWVCWPLTSPPWGTRPTTGNPYQVWCLRWVIVVGQPSVAWGLEQAVNAALAWSEATLAAP